MHSSSNYSFDVPLRWTLAVDLVDLIGASKSQCVCNQHINDRSETKICFKLVTNEFCLMLYTSYWTLRCIIENFFLIITMFACCEKQKQNNNKQINNFFLLNIFKKLIHKSTNNKVNTSIILLTLNSDFIFVLGCR